MRCHCMKRGAMPGVREYHTMRASWWQANIYWLFHEFGRRVPK